MYHLYIDSYGTTSILFYYIYLHYVICFIVVALLEEPVT